MRNNDARLRTSVLRCTKPNCVSSSILMFNCAWVSVFIYTIRICWAINTSQVSWSKVAATFSWRLSSKDSGKIWYLSQSMNISWIKIRIVKKFVNACTNALWSYSIMTSVWDVILAVSTQKARAFPEEHISAGGSHSKMNPIRNLFIFSETIDIPWRLSRNQCRVEI